jgi:vacuolar-type H+-ATPase subunit I/STV1
MNLIERLEESIANGRVSTDEAQEAVAALREQEIHIEDCSKRNETDVDVIAKLQARIDKLEAEIESMHEDAAGESI